jgi:hypothetical protein
MSLSYDLNIGPYIKVKALVEIVEKKVRQCPNHEGINNGKFCLECGSELIETTKQEKYDVNIIDVIESEEMWCYTKGEYSYIFNNKSPHIGIYEPEENTMVEIKEDDISSQIEEFKKRHKENICKIEEYTGEKVIIGYGIFNHVW